jgi:hypothetical protein
MACKRTTSRLGAKPREVNCLMPARSRGVQQASTDAEMANKEIWPSFPAVCRVIESLDKIKAVSCVLL